jgi:carbonic anhydrase
MKATLYSPNVTLGTLAVLAAGTLLAHAVTSITPDEGLAALQEGNSRFAEGKPAHPHEDATRRAEVAKGQNPFVTVLSCADSRVPVELLMDQGIGDTFVVRVAGNVSDTDEIGTIEYGVGHLGTPLLVVLGHTSCGAVKAVLEGAEVHGNLRELVANIGPAVAQAKAANPGGAVAALMASAVTANVWISIDDLFKHSAEVRELVKEGKLKVVGAVYNLETGKVNWLGSHPEQARIMAYRDEGEAAHGAGESHAASPAGHPSAAGGHGAGGAHAAAAGAGSAASHASAGGKPVAVGKTAAAGKGAASHGSTDGSRASASAVGPGQSANILAGVTVTAALIGLGFGAYRVSRLSSLQTRIWVNSALLLTLLLGASGYAWYEFSKIGHELESISAQDLPILSNLAELEAKMLEEELDLERFAASNNTYFAAEFGRVGAEVDQELGLVKVELDKSLSRAAGGDVRRSFQMMLDRLTELSQEHTRFDQHGVDLVAAVKGGQRQRAEELKTLMERVGHEMHATVSHLAEVVKEGTHHEALQVQAEKSQAQGILAIVGLVGLGIGILSATGFVRGLA